MTEVDSTPRGTGSWRGSRLVRWIKRLGIGLSVLLLGASMAGAAYQTIADRIELQRYPAPGRLVDIGGRRLHLHCQGEGSPTVVLEAGLGEASVTWASVQPGIAGFTRACAYDRAGYGWSDAGPGPRSAGQIAGDLRQLLQRAEVPAPHVLVGHSFGGPLVLLYAHRHPEDVEGLVLVDASHQDQLERLPQPPAALMLAYRAMTMLAPIGLPRLLLPSLFDDSALPMAPQTRQVRRALAVRTSAVRAAGAEFAALEHSLAELRAASRPLQGVPLIVLSAGRMDVMPGQSEEQRLETARIWDELQQDLTRKSDLGRRTIASQSGHFIQFDEPDLVVEAVRAVVAAIRRRGRP